MLLPELGVVDVLLRGVAEDRLDLRAHVGRRHVLVRDVDVDDRRDLLHQRAVLRLGLVELGLRLHQLRDVEHDPQPVQWAPVVVGDQDRLLTDPHDPPVAMDGPVLRPERLAGGHRALALEVDAIEIGGMDRVGPRVRTAQELLASDPEQVRDARAHVDHRLVLGDPVDVEHGRQSIDDASIPELELSEPVLAPLSGCVEEALGGRRWILRDGLDLSRHGSPQRPRDAADSSRNSSARRRRDLTGPRSRAGGTQKLCSAARLVGQQRTEQDRVPLTRIRPGRERVR